MTIASPHMTPSGLLRHPANEASQYSDGTVSHRTQRHPTRRARLVRCGLRTTAAPSPR
jgi:hypothetical protein